MPIKIERTNVLVNGIKCYRIDRIEALTREQLPEKYFDNKPFVYKFNDEEKTKLRISYVERIGVDYNRKYDIFEGQVVYANIYDGLVPIIHDAGKRLQEINEWKKSWEGKKVIELI